MIPKYSLTLETIPEISGKELNALDRSRWDESKRNVLDYFDRNGIRVHEEFIYSDLEVRNSFYNLDFGNYIAGVVISIKEKVSQGRKILDMKVIMASDHRSLDGIANDILNRANGLLRKKEENKGLSHCAYRHFGIDL